MNLERIISVLTDSNYKVESEIHMPYGENVTWMGETEDGEYVSLYENNDGEWVLESGDLIEGASSQELVTNEAVTIGKMAQLIESRL